MKRKIPLLVAGSWEAGPRSLVVRRAYDGGGAGATWYASDEQVERAVAAAHAVRDEALALPLHARAERGRRPGSGGRADRGALPTSAR